tara:strand:+ start:17749 stop:18111 length:363 start_codon:yes stop_codon:yes gene_type:complete
LRKKRKPNKYQILIGKFCKDPASIWTNKGKVKAEMAVAKKLYELNSSEDFWRKAYLPFKVNTLRWFLTPDGKAFIKLEVRRQKLDIKPKKSYTLSEDKVGKDKPITKKILKLKDFLNAKN